MQATEKLAELCDRFEEDVIGRARRARERANLPQEATQIPDYRQLLLTKKFAKFSRCTCDHPKQPQQTTGASGSGFDPASKSSSHCRKHNSHRSSASSSSSSSSPSEDDDDDESTMDDDDDDDNEESTSSSSSLTSSLSRRRRSSKNEKEVSSSSLKKVSNKTEADDGEDLEQGEIVDEDVGGVNKAKVADAEAVVKKKAKPKEDEFDDIRSMELHRKQNHPERLHPDLSFNEPDQVDSLILLGLFKLIFS